jgi:outer membrane protein insertion porin family
VAETTKAFTDHFGNFGFAFAQVEAVPEVDRVNNRVAWCCGRAVAPRLCAPHQRQRQQPHARRSDPPRVPPVRSELVRRRQDRLSRDRVDRLGFFTEVNVETQEVPGAPDQVDLVEVKSKSPPATLQLGAGFRPGREGWLTFGIKQENVFGSGN